MRHYIDVWMMRALLLAVLGLYAGVAYCAWLRPLQGDQIAVLFTFSFAVALVLAALTVDRWRRDLPSLWWLATRWDD